MIKKLWIRLLTDLWATKAPPPPDWYKADIGEKPEYPDGLLDEYADAKYECEQLGAIYVDESVWTNAQSEAMSTLRVIAAKIESVDEDRDAWAVDMERHRVYDWPYEYARRVLENRDE
jgi:hypothetical protein